MNKKVLYRKAYRMLEDSTPLKFDCGLLCSSKCCSGDNDEGMYLFPGEELMFDRHGGFLTIREEKLLQTDVLFAVCDGTCDRKLRPLACRIFPYIPYQDKNGRLTVIEDPRARYICPLLMGFPEVKIDLMFKRNISKVFHLLMKDNDIKSYLCLLSGVLEEYKRFLRSK